MKMPPPLFCYKCHIESLYVNLSVKFLNFMLVVIVVTTIVSVELDYENFEIGGNLWAFFLKNYKF